MALLTSWIIQEMLSSTSLKKTCALSVQVSSQAVNQCQWKQDDTCSPLPTCLDPFVGLFGFSAAHNKPSFIYTTFSNKIYVYHCISLTTIPPSNLLLTYRSRVSSHCSRVWWIRVTVVAMSLFEVQENLPRSVFKTVEGLNGKATWQDSDMIYVILCVSSYRQGKEGIV